MYVGSATPAEAAGLKEGDIILAIGDNKVTRENFVSIVNRYKPSDRVLFTIKRDRNTLKITVTVGERGSTNYHLEELKDATPEMRALRAAWLNG